MVEQSYIKTFVLRLIHKLNKINLDVEEIKEERRVFLETQRQSNELKDLFRVK